MRWQTLALVAFLSPGLPLLGDFFAASSQTSEPEPNLSFEIDVSPQDEKPDGWVVFAQNGAGFEYKRGSAAAGRWCIVLKTSKPDQSCRIGLPAATVIKPNQWYRVRYWALAKGDSVRYGWRFANADLKELSDVLEAMEQMPKGDGKWHLQQTAAFRVTEVQLERHPMLTFCLDAGHAGSVDLDDIAITRSAPD